jgi:hypothetical protein
MSSDTTEQAPTTGGAGIPGASEGGATPAPTPAASEKTFTQADLDRLLKERLAEEKQRADRARAAAEAKAAEEAAAKAGEWQTVAEQRKAAAEQAEATAQRLQAERDELAAVVERTVKARQKTLPDELRDLMPAGTPAQQLAWLEQAEKAAAKLGGQPRTPGTPAGPRGIGGQPTPVGATADDIIAQKRRQIGGL